MWKTAIHSWRDNLTRDRMLETVDYDVEGEITSHHPEWADCMGNALRLLRECVLCWEESTQRARELAMGRPEQKSMSRIYSLLPKFGRSVAAVVDCCTAASSLFWKR